MIVITFCLELEAVPGVASCPCLEGFVASTAWPCERGGVYVLGAWASGEVFRSGLSQKKRLGLGRPGLRCPGAALQPGEQGGGEWAGARKHRGGEKGMSEEKSCLVSTRSSKLSAPGQPHLD